MKNTLLDLDLQFFADGEVGAEAQEVADPVTDAMEDSSTSTEGTETTETTDTSDVQSAEENAKYAAARRRAEAEFNQRQQTLDAEFARRFADYENPITHKPITSQKEYFEALDALEKLNFEEKLEAGGIDPQTFEEAVNRQVKNNPMVLQAQQIMERANQEYWAQKTEQSIKEISALDPSIKSLEDIFALPNAGEMIEMVKATNMSLADVYKLKNFDALMAGKVAGAKQAALNNMNGTSHLSQTGGVANETAEVEIPQDELAQWKRAFPNATHAELRKKYNSTL